MKTLIALLLTLTTTVALAQPKQQQKSDATKSGPIAGGGGKVVVCYKDKTKESIDTVTLLDLWEGSKRKSRFSYYSDRVDKLSEDQLLQLAISKSRTLLSGEETSGISPIQKTLEKTIREFDKEKEEIPGITLELTDDSYELIKPVPPCYIEQAVNYHPVEGPIVSADLLKHMNKRNRVALRYHEGFYALLRQTDDTDNSLSTRRLTSMLFSDQHLFSDVENSTSTPIAKPTYDGLIDVGSNKWECRSVKANGKTDMHFFVLDRTVNNELISYAQFIYLDGTAMISQTLYNFTTRKLHSLFQYDFDIEVYKNPTSRLRNAYMVNIKSRGQQTQTQEVQCY